MTSPSLPRVCLTVGTLVAAVAMLLSAMLFSLAQTRPPGQVPYLQFPNSGAPTVAPPAGKGSSKLDALEQRDKELRDVRDAQKKARELEGKLQREIEQIGDDRRKLARQLIEVAARVRSIEQQVTATERRLADLDEKEQALRNSLEQRRYAIGNVLAALQRIGRHPPPAMLVSPDDALQSLRSAILIGAVLPDMRRDLEAVVNDLTTLVALRRDIGAGRAGLDHSRAALERDQVELTALTTFRQKQQADIEKSLTGERQRAAQLARQSEDLQALIAKLEQDLDAPTRAARLAARQGAEKKAAEPKASGLAALKDPGRLAPAIPFARAKGTLPLPVNGVRIREFGTADGNGGQEKGLSLSTRPGAQITAPCDGWVVYAGNFRNYGQLLILNAGDGYHVLLAGMDRISVDLGQFVVTGEPVAVMGERAQAAAAIATGSGQPVLYVEFRKDGAPVDSGPWWAASDSEKVRG